MPNTHHGHPEHIYKMGAHSLHAHGDLTSLAPHERLPEFLVLHQEETPEMPPSSRAEGLLFLHGLESNPGSSLQTEEESGGLQFMGSQKHLSVCPGPNFPLQGRHGSRGCIPGSPGESGLVSRGSQLAPRYIHGI